MPPNPEPRASSSSSLSVREETRRTRPQAGAPSSLGLSVRAAAFFLLLPGPKCRLVSDLIVGERRNGPGLNCQTALPAHGLALLARPPAAKSSSYYHLLATGDNEILRAFTSPPALLLLAFCLCGCCLLLPPSRVVARDDHHTTTHNKLSSRHHFPCSLRFRPPFLSNCPTGHGGACVEHLRCACGSWRQHSPPHAPRVKRPLAAGPPGHSSQRQGWEGL